MSIFDNVTSIVINDKEVKSISVDGGVIYEADEPVVYDVTVLVYDSATDDPVSGVSATIGETTNTTDSNGSCVFNDMSSGTVMLRLIKNDYNQKDEEITIDSEHTQFRVPFVPLEPQE